MRTIATLSVGNTVSLPYAKQIAEVLVPFYRQCLDEGYNKFRFDDRIQSRRCRLALREACSSKSEYDLVTQIFRIDREEYRENVLRYDVQGNDVYVSKSPDIQMKPSYYRDIEMVKDCDRVLCVDRIFRGMENIVSRKPLSYFLTNRRNISWVFSSAGHRLIQQFCTDILDIGLLSCEQNPFLDYPMLYADVERLYKFRK